MAEEKRNCSVPFVRDMKMPMTSGERVLVDRLVQSMAFPDDPVDEVIVGPKLAFVRSGERAAISATLGASGDLPRSIAPYLEGLTLGEAALMLYDGLLLNRSLGAAALNAGLDPVGDGENVNALEILIERGAGRDMVMVGDFPFTGRLREAAGTLHLLELKDVPDRVPPERWSAVLGACDVAGITGTALLTRSMSRYLEESSQAFRLILGSTTPLSPVLFEHYGVDVLAGSTVGDMDRLREGVREGLCISALHKNGALRFLNMIRPGGEG
jgi:hypothetical protein